MEFKGRNDYSVAVFNERGYLGFLLYVHDLHALARWLDASYRYSSWTHINVYARRSRRFIAQYKKQIYFPAKPR